MLLRTRCVSDTGRHAILLLALLQPSLMQLTRLLRADEAPRGVGVESGVPAMLDSARSFGDVLTHRLADGATLMALVVVGLPSAKFGLRICVFATSDDQARSCEGKVEGGGWLGCDGWRGMCHSSDFSSSLPRRLLVLPSTCLKAKQNKSAGMRRGQQACLLLCALCLWGQGAAVRISLYGADLCIHRASR